MSDIQQDKYKVSIKLVSSQGDKHTVLQATGDAFTRGEQIYIRYEEVQQGPSGERISVRTMLKVSKDQVKLIRHGGVESEQAFAAGARLPGFYRSPYTQFNLSTETKKLEVIREGRSLTIKWEYDLYVYEELSETFAISLHIQEEPKL